MEENKDTIKKEETKTEEKAEKKENSFDTEKLKSETSNTVNQVKDTIKNVNIKQDSIDTKNFVVDMLVKPVEKIKEVVEDNTGKTFKFALIIIAVWTVILLLRVCFSGIFSRTAGDAIWSIIKAIITPTLGIGILSVIVLMLNKESKKSLTSTITAVTITKIPTIIALLISMLNLISYQAYRITSPISGLCSVITIGLTYIAIKFLTNKEDSQAIKTFVIVEAIYYAIAFVLSFLTISI